MSRWTHLRPVLLVAACAAAGCGGEQKPDAESPPPAPATPEGNPPAGAPAGSGEPKHKVAAADFIKEFTTNDRAANTKYAGSVVELSGPVLRPATLETDDFGKLVGAPGSYNAVLTFGTDNAKRSDFVVVRGLKPSLVGTVFAGQKVRVKGKVAKADGLNPIELTNAELIDAGADPSIPLDYTKFYGPKARDYMNQFETTAARVTGTVLKRGTDVTEYVELQLTAKDKLRCYFIEGTELYKSRFEPGTKATFVGMMKVRGIDKGTPFSGLANVLSDAVAVLPPEPEPKP